MMNRGHQVQYKPIPKEMAYDDDFDISVLPIVITEYQADKKWPNHIVQRAISIMQYAKQSCGHNNGQMRIA